MTANTDSKINNGGDGETGNQVDGRDGGRDGDRVDNRVADRSDSGAGNVVVLRPREPGSVAAAAETALAAFGTHLGRAEARRRKRDGDE